VILSLFSVEQYQEMKMLNSEPGRALESVSEAASREPEAVAVNVDEGFILLEDNGMALIDLYIDCFGCDCEPDEAVVVVARIGEGIHVGKWIVVELKHFQEVEIN
jgi:hypothetical protein